MSSRRGRSRSKCSGSCCCGCWSGRRCTENVYALRELGGFNGIAGTIESGRSGGYHCMPSRERKRKRTKVYGAIRAGGNVCRAEEMLSLTEARRITGGAGEELEMKHRACHAVQGSGKRDIAVRKRC
jgi:hypothetical protein